MTRYTVDGRRVVLGERLGRGGEGDVHVVEGDAASVVKLYTLQDLGERDRKIPAMVRRRLDLASPQVTFPRGVLRDAQDRFRGFTMLRAPAGRPVHDLYSPASRKRHFPDADFRFLVHVAANVARAVGAVHKAGCVIGDINHSRFLIGANALVTVIDADSFQFQDGTDRYLCRVGVPEFTAPELQGRSLDGIVRTQEHDAFGLAVLLFQLLYLGRHPFAGVPKGGDLPLPEAIRGHHFAYSRARQTRLDPPPNMLDLDAHGPDLAHLFETAFAPLGPAGRPKIDRWLQSLTGLRDGLKRCAAVSEHHHAVSVRACPWCRVERGANVILFLPPFRPTQAGQGGSMPSFDLAAMRARLRALGLPQSFAYAALPSSAFGSSSQSGSGGLLGWLKRLFNPATQEIADLAAVDRALRSAFDRINGTVALDRLWSVVIEVAKLALERSKLGSTFVHAEENARHMMRQTALMAFLDRRFLKHETIRGIGASLQTTLAAFGFETAGDVRRGGSWRLQQVQGIGPVKAQALIDWTKQVQRGFQVPRELDAAARADLQRTRAQLVEQAVQADRDMALRLDQIEAERRRIAALRTAPNAEIAQLVSERARLVRTIEAKSGSPSTLSPPPEIRVSDRLRSTLDEALRTPPTPSAPPVPATTAARVQGPATGALSCPTCGGPMVRRTSRRGPRPGRPFYGCSRFPRCTGTRAIP